MTIPRIKEIEVSELGTNSVVLKFNDHKYKFNGYQIHQLERVVNKLALECTAGLPDDHGVEISGIYQ